MDKLELLLAMAKDKQFFHVKNPQVLYRFGSIVEMTDAGGKWCTGVVYYEAGVAGSYARPLDCFGNFRVADYHEHMLDPFEVEVL